MKIKAIKYIGDIISKTGFKWNGVGYYTCGFYRIRKNNGTYYLEKYLFYKNHRVVYKDICYLYVHDVEYSWIEHEVNEDDYNTFINNLKKAARDTKLKRISGYFKHSEEHYASLHYKNK